MERKSFGWVWAGVGVVAVLILVTSGVWRQSSPALTSPQSATPPIIVEPIQPTAAAQLPPLVSGGQADAASTITTADASATAQTTTLASATGSSMALPSEGSARVKAIQVALQAAGYSPGAADGKMGRQTQKAIREFQEANGLSVDGKVGPRTWAKLSPYAGDASTGAANQ